VLFRVQNMFVGVPNNVCCVARLLTLNPEHFLVAQKRRLGRVLWAVLRSGRIDRPPELILALTFWISGPTGPRQRTQQQHGQQRTNEQRGREGRKREGNKVCKFMGRHAPPSLSWSRGRKRQTNTNMYDVRKLQNRVF
jgi:hypothetical protein